MRGDEPDPRDRGGAVGRPQRIDRADELGEVRAGVAVLVPPDRALGVDVREAPLGREVVERGYPAFKTNIVVPGDEPRVLMPGFGRDGGIDRNPTAELLEALTRLLEAFREGTDGRAQPIVDLNFNLTTEGIVRVARALESYDLAWLEVDSYDPAALAHARRRSPIALCSGENLYTLRGFRPYLEAGAMDVASVDVIWNGFAQALKIAALVETHFGYEEKRIVAGGLRRSNRGICASRARRAYAVCGGATIGGGSFAASTSNGAAT